MNTDEQLKEEINEELSWDPKLRQAAITVSVRSGIAILTGHTGSYGAKLAAEEAVRHLKNVKGVVEQITVKLPPEHQRTDNQIEEAIVVMLQWNAAIPQHCVRVSVENGWVALEGEVDWQFERETANNLVKDTMGIKGLSNLISIHAHNVPAALNDTIRHALQRSADIDAGKISVETSGSIVTLRGRAHSWNERNEIERMVWCAPGITEVEDELVVA